MQIWQYIYEHGLKDFSIGRLVESLIFLGVLLARIKPTFDKLDKRVEKIADIIEKGFSNGEERFTEIEGRLAKLEKEITPPSLRPENQHNHSVAYPDSRPDMRP